MSRHNLTDSEWKSIRVFLPTEHHGRAGRPWCNHRQVINGILWVLFVGRSWHDVPAADRLAGVSMLPELGIATRWYDRFARFMFQNVMDFLLIIGLYPKNRST